MSVNNPGGAPANKMPPRKYYAVFSTPVGSPDQIRAALPAHLAYMTDLENRDVVFASGPLTEGGPPNGTGMTILHAASAQEAKAIAEADPFFKSGLRRFDIKEWTLMEGTLGIGLRLSDHAPGAK